MSTTYTLTYSEKFQGFPSFYSYIPDYMIGMNSHFYTFHKGDMYKHNVATTIGGATVPRNNFYGTQYNSDVTILVNDNPSAVTSPTGLSTSPFLNPNPFLVILNDSTV